MSDVSFGIVLTLPEKQVPRTKLPLVPGWTDIPSLKRRVESNLVVQGNQLYKTWKRQTDGTRIQAQSRLNKEFLQGLILYFEGQSFIHSVEEA